LFAENIFFCEYFPFFSELLDCRWWFTAF